jgi:hypothetical protein
MPRIIVLGAGELGLSVIEALSTGKSGSSSGLKDSLELAILLRPRPEDDPDRQSLVQHLMNLHKLSASRLLKPITIIYTNINSPDLHTHLAGHDVVISALGFSAGSGTQLRVCHAAMQARVSWFFPWQFGIDYDIIGRGSAQPVFDEQLDVRDLLRQQEGMRWTIVSTGIFTSFLFDPAFGVVRIIPEEYETSLDDRGGSHGAPPIKDSAAKHLHDRKQVVITALGDWGNRVTMTSAKDIGRITAEIIMRNAAGSSAKHSGVVYTAGSTITFTDLERRGWQVMRHLKTVGQLELEVQSDPRNVGAKYQLVWAKNLGVAWSRLNTWNAQNGMEVQGLEDWIEENLVA